MNDLPVLNQLLHLWGPPDYHEQRVREQAEGVGLWLIAWRDDEPVGHLQIKWSGSDRPQLKVHVNDCPQLSAIGVKPELRSEGIGTTLIEAAENIVRQKGYEQVGVGVSLDNVRARQLYERLGYKDWGHGTYRITWYRYRERGDKEQVEEMCIYLLKKL
jgi:ribosomal protein S18 acetylase RimI-like enzyme